MQPRMGQTHRSCLPGLDMPPYVHWNATPDRGPKRSPATSPSTTRRALVVAAGLVERFADGVWLVDLAPVQAPDLVPYAVAAVLRRLERPGEALLDTLVAYLRDRELLLVLDNCEHLIDACADL